MYDDVKSIFIAVFTFVIFPLLYIPMGCTFSYITSLVNFEHFYHSRPLIAN